jgi:hypothetical protein
MGPAGRLLNLINKNTVSNFAVEFWRQIFILMLHTLWVKSGAQCCCRKLENGKGLELGAFSTASVNWFGGFAIQIRWREKVKSSS